MKTCFKGAMLPGLASWLVSSDQEGLGLAAVKSKVAAGVVQAGVEGRDGVGGVVLGFDIDLGVISVTVEADVMPSDDVSNRLIEDKMGPSTDPCGTLHVTAASSDRQQPIRRTSVALIRAVSVQCAGQTPDWKTL